jgi:hypothetical protein
MYSPTPCGHTSSQKVSGRICLIRWLEIGVHGIFPQSMICRASDKVLASYGEREDWLSVGWSASNGFKRAFAPLCLQCHLKNMELLGVEPRASCMLSTRSTN